jgi:integrase
LAPLGKPSWHAGKHLKAEHGARHGAGTGTAPALAPGAAGEPADATAPAAATAAAQKDEENSRKRRWTVERGSASVKIYLTPHGKKKYYTISYWLDGKRKRQVFKTLQKAKDAAGDKATNMTNGDLGAAKLTNADSAAYFRAIALLEPVGAALEFAASEYASAVKRLGAVSLSQAVDFYLKQHPVHLEPKMVRSVVDELLRTKESDGVSARYRRQLRYDVNRFAERFHCRIGDVSGTDIDTWLRSLGVGPRTRNNVRNSVQTLFNFAIARKYLPKDHDELDAVPVVRDGDGDIEIFTPGEMAEVLAVADGHTVPFLAIAAFAGVRHAELSRLDWSQVKRKAKIIEIKAGTAKTASRRVIPILPNLAKWLADHWKESGAVCPYVNMVDEIVEVTRRVNVARRSAWAKANGVSEDALKAADERARERLAEARKKASKNGGKVPMLPGAETAAEEGWTPFLWKHNALRHSFISYRVAQIQNVAQVALEAGNSPGMIFKHYRELVREADGKKWFAIAPGTR